MQKEKCAIFVTKLCHWLTEYNKSKSAVSPAVAKALKKNPTLRDRTDNQVLSDPSISWDCLRIDIEFKVACLDFLKMDYLSGDGSLKLKEHFESDKLMKTV